MIVGYYTRGTPYEVEAEGLKASCKEHGLGYHVEGVDHPGTWAKATLLNAIQIVEARKAYPAEVLLYLDADARVRKMPDVSQWQGFDVGLYYLDCPARSPDASGLELCTGTTIWWPTPAANELMSAWLLANAEPEANKRFNTDQAILQLLVAERPWLKVLKLPPTWCWMDRISDRFGKAEDAVIFHTQASRRHKRSVGG